LIPGAWVDFLAMLLALLAQMLGLDPANYPIGRMTYDLRRLRLHGIIERIPHSHRYQLTPAGILSFACRIRPTHYRNRNLLQGGAARRLNLTHSLQIS
jgi:hypothetical protein